jgi:hypothetical protein
MSELPRNQWERKGTNFEDIPESYIGEHELKQTKFFIDKVNKEIYLFRSFPKVMHETALNAMGRNREDFTGGNLEITEESVNYIRGAMTIPAADANELGEAIINNYPIRYFTMIQDKAHELGVDSDDEL